MFESCESGSWINRKESIGIYPNLETNHIYQLVVSETYYSFKRLGSCSSGGRNFTETYYLIDYSLEKNRVVYRAYKIVKSNHKINEDTLVKKYCSGDLKYANFISAFENRNNYRETQPKHSDEYITTVPVPDSIKYNSQGEINYPITYASKEGIKSLWFNQRTTPLINPEWMLYGFDEIWFVDHGICYYYYIPYKKLIKKLT